MLHAFQMPILLYIKFCIYFSHKQNIYFEEQFLYTSTLEIEVPFPTMYYLIIQKGKK